MSVRLSAVLAERHLDVSLHVGAGETLALLGPNGAGKSTILEVLAGLIRPDLGHASAGGQVLFDLPHVWLPPHRRSTGLLAQEALLFPHLDVSANVAFGPRSRGVTRAVASAAAGQRLAEVDAGELAGRMPATLSGGQAQRVALARALATQPDVLLLDEPLAALDVEVAAMVRHTLRRVLDGRSALLATHEILDVVLLADRVAVLDRGRVVEEGPTTLVTRQPRSAFAAALLGVNLLSGTVDGPYAVRTDAGLVVVGEPDQPLRPGQRAVALFRPSSVSVHRDPAGGSVRNDFAAVIDAVEPQAHLVRIRAGGIDADVTPESVATLGLAPGVRVHLAVKAAEVSLYHS